jgi:hypothetical protein
MGSFCSTVFVKLKLFTLVLGEMVAGAGILVGWAEAKFENITIQIRTDEQLLEMKK